MVYMVYAKPQGDSKFHPMSRGGIAGNVIYGLMFETENEAKDAIMRARQRELPFISGKIQYKIVKVR